jgi:hypothetical protein
MCACCVLVVCIANKYIFNVYSLHSFHFESLNADVGPSSTTYLVGSDTSLSRQIACEVSELLKAQI